MFLENCSTVSHSHTHNTSSILMTGIHFDSLPSSKILANVIRSALLSPFIHFGDLYSVSARLLHRTAQVLSLRYVTDTSQAPPLPQNGHTSKLNSHQHNGRPSLDGAWSPSTVNGVGAGGPNSPTAADGTIARRIQASKAAGQCAELRMTLAKLDDRAAFLQQLPAETRKFLQQWFSDTEREGSSVR